MPFPSTMSCGAAGDKRESHAPVYDAPTLIADKSLLIERNK